MFQGRQPTNAEIAALLGLDRARPAPSMAKPKFSFAAPRFTPRGSIQATPKSVAGTIQATIASGLQKVGISERKAHQFASRAMLPLTDATPVGNLTGAEEGKNQFYRGLTKGDLGQMAAGAGIFGLSVAPLPGGVKRAGKKVGTGMFGSMLKDKGGAIRAWHVSPHDFDRFSLNHLGTGEGAQAYGKGLYFTEQADGPTANHYRKLFGPKSKTYEVEIDANPEHLLDYDAPSWGQPERVQSLMREAGMYRDKPELPITQTPSGRFSLRDQWGQSAGAFKTREAAEARAQEMIDGMGRGTGTLLYTRLGGNTYFPHLDDGSATRRLLQEGVRGGRWLNASGEPNFVVFDDGLIDIVNKY